MPNVRRFSSLAFLLVLALLLAAPWPVAAIPSDTPRAEAAASPSHLLVEWLSGLWGDNGCTFDPNGGCRDTASSESPSGTDGLDNGCIFDPGGCRDNG